MKHFYGYQRSEKDAPEGVDECWLDDETTDRQERHDMMLVLSPDEDHPEGHDVFVVSTGDIGQGAEAKSIKDKLIEWGVRLKVIEQDPVPETRGRPAHFDPDATQDKKIAALYRSYNTMSYVLRRVEKIMGQRFEAHHLKRRYGNRWKK